MYVQVYWSYGKLYISIVRINFPLVDHISILALLYKLTTSFTKIFQA